MDFLTWWQSFLNYSATQYPLPRPLVNPRVHNHIHNIHTLGPVMSQLHTVYDLIEYN